jgi:hypothetical protein
MTAPFKLSEWREDCAVFGDLRDDMYGLLSPSSDAKN